MSLGDYRGAIVAITRLGDVSRGLGVAVDVLPFLMDSEVLVSIPTDVLIDIYILLLPILVGVLQSSYEEYVALLPILPFPFFFPFLPV